MTWFTRFSLEIRKTILFFFWSILKDILEAKRINKEGRKEASRGRSGLLLRGRPWIPCVLWLSFVGSCSRINPIVKYGGYLQFKN